MSFISWFCRCLPAFSIVAVLIVYYAALVVEPYGRRTNGKHEGVANISQYILAIFFVLLHLAAACFPVRLCFALYDLLQHLREASHELMYHERKDGAAEEFPVKLEAPSTVHAIIIPNYQEQIGTLTDMLSVLAAHPMAAMTYDVRETTAR